MQIRVLNLALVGLLTIAAGAVGCSDASSNDDPNSSEAELRKSGDGGVVKSTGKSKVKTHGHDGGDEGQDDDADDAGDESGDLDESGDESEEGDGGHGFGKGGNPDKGGNGKGHDAG